MELLIAVGLIVAFWLLRGQGQRIKALETELAVLRTGQQPEAAIAAGAPAAVSEEFDASTTEAAVLAKPAPQMSGHDPEPYADDLRNEDEPVAETAAGPWQRAAAAQAGAEGVLREPARPERPDIETALGTRWAVWVGGVALALGGVFLVRYSIEAGYFGPAVRLAAAAIFGVLLAAAGEAARRTGFRTPIGGLDAAYVPAILTGVAAFTLFAVVFAAHGVYLYIGPSTAFVLLAAIALATIAAALIHGQVLAGLGLLGSFLTPGLVSSSEPDPWVLFVYLAVVLAASVAIAAIRRWRFLSTAAYVGGGLWSVAYLTGAIGVLPLPVLLYHLVGLAALAAIWLARPDEATASRPDPASVAAGAFAALATFLLLPPWDVPAPWSAATAALLIAAMLAVAAWRAAAPLLHAAGIATVALAVRHLLSGRFEIDLYAGHVFIDGSWVQAAPDAFLPLSYLLGALFLFGGIALAWLTVARDHLRAAQWASWAAIAPLAVVASAWLMTGNLDIDWRFAAPGLGIALVLVAGADTVARVERRPLSGGWAVSLLLAGAAAALCFVFLAGFGPFWTTVLTGLAAVLPAVATQFRRYRALGWLAAGFAAATFVRIGIDPTIVGPELLATRPFLNALLPGYLVPATAFAYAAWQLARTTGGRPRLAMEAFAAIFALVGAAMLVRHAMNGGVIEPGAPTLAEQAIYSLIMIGAGALLLALDNRSPSPVFRWGSIAAGVVGVAMVAFAHLIALNPFFTNESTGRIPVLNLLLLAYLLPAVALAALAWLARGRRPQWYVSMLAAAAAVLAFAYVTLSVRRVFHGEFIGAWKDFGALETYTYSAVWLALGVAILAAGLRFNSRVLRLGSSVLVVAAVAKVFLWDMRELEGVLRALSFIGLGGVLIGIGMFYQRMLARMPR